MTDETSATISGLREQIKANAVHLFPSLTAAHTARYTGTNTYLYIPPTSAFDIALVKITLPGTILVKVSPSKKRKEPELEPRTRGWQAYLTYSTPAGCKRAAQGGPRADVEGALRSLLEVTGRCLAEKTLQVFSGEGLGMWKAFGGGFVDEEAAVGDQRQMG